MAEIQDLSVTDASNTGRWPENMPFSGVNDAGRADEGILARWYRDTNGSITASGSANAFAITSNRTIAALFDGLVMVFTANFSITGAPTLNLNGLGAKNIKKFNGDALSTGDIVSGQPLIVCYKLSPDQWYMLAPGTITSQQYLDFNENAAPGNPAADVGRIYAFDDTGTTRLAYRDSAGAVSVLGPTATQAQMEAASSTTVSTSPGRQHLHPGHPKCGGQFDGSAGSPAFASGDYGMATITDNGTGNWTVSFDTAFSATTYWCNGWARSYSGSAKVALCAPVGGTKTTSTFQVITGETSTGNNVDSQEVALTFWGDYP